MRLRISVSRHSLPQVDVLWNANDGSTTIAQLLDQINHVVPLEAEHWGLEDYTVRVGKFECLHYSKIDDVLKEDDVVSICYLQTHQQRARVLGGRYQINANGQLLYDGIPFARPYLRHPNRPAVTIPPPKKRRLDYPQPDEDDDEADETHNPLLLDYQNPGDSDEEDEDDGDFDPNSGAAESSDSGSDSGSDGGQIEDDNESDDGSFEGFGTEDDSGSDLSSSDSDRSSDSSDSAPEEHTIQRQKHGTKTEDEARAQKSKLQTPAKASNAINSANTNQIFTPPGEGKPETHTRNARRHLSKKLKALKRDGILSEDANLEDLRAYQSGSSSTLEISRRVSSRTSVPEKTQDDQKSASQPLDVPSNVSQNDHITGDSKSSEDAIFEAKRKALLDALASGGVDATSETPKPLPPSATDDTPATYGSLGSLMSSLSKAPSQTLTPSRQTGGDTHAEASASSSAHKRARLDVASTRRMLFGSLGVRNPQNSEDEEKLREKLKSQATRKPVLKDIPPSGTNQEESVVEEEPDNQENPAPQALPELQDGIEDHDPDAWKSKIILSAVECTDPSIELSTPPFPFQQRWDPQQQFPEKRGKKRRRESDWLEETEYSRRFGYDYDQAPSYQDDSYVELDYDGNGEDVNGQQELEAAEEDLPEAPNDVSSLPELTPPETLPGAVIVFQQLEVSAATNWNPQLSPWRTARIDEVFDSNGDVLLTLHLAQRDLSRPRKRFDQQGRRIYDKFEAIESDEEAEEDSIQVAMSNLLDPRLLVPVDSSLRPDTNGADEHVNGVSVDPPDDQALEDGNSSEEDEKSSGDAMGENVVVASPAPRRSSSTGAEEPREARTGKTRRSTRKRSQKSAEA